MITKEEVKSRRLKGLEKKLIIIEKSKNHLGQKLFKINTKEKELKEKIRKEKQAISLTKFKKKKIKLLKKKKIKLLKYKQKKEGKEKDLRAYKRRISRRIERNKK